MHILHGKKVAQFARFATLLALVTLAGTPRSACAADDDGVAFASVLEMEMLEPGPGVGEFTLPKPTSKATPRPTIEEPEPETNSTRRVHGLAGLDLTNAYYSRGLRQEDKGLIAQPFAGIGWDVVRAEDHTVQVYLGTWHSLHGEKTAASNPDDSVAVWYEGDVYAGVSAELGDWTFGAQYGWFLSPSDAFTTVEELQLSVEFDDSEAMGQWALSPSAVLVIETGDGTSDGLEKGAYLQLGIEPGIDIETERVADLRISFPVMVGLSAWDYYEHDDTDDTLGFASAGVKCSCVLHESDAWGALSGYVSLNILALGDLAKSVNDDDATAIVVAAGLSYEF